MMRQVLQETTIKGKKEAWVGARQDGEVDARDSENSDSDFYGGERGK